MRGLLFFLFLCSTLFGFSQNKYVARVTDAETGELLPFASVVRPDGQGTISNLKGEFVIEAMPTDTLRITCFAHQERSVCASDLGDIIQLHLLARSLNELVVTPKETLLVLISKQFSREFKHNRNNKARYFYRQRDVDSISSSLYEGFVDALSCGNLRESIMRTGADCGQRGYQYIQYAHSSRSDDAGFTFLETK